MNTQQQMQQQQQQQQAMLARLKNDAVLLMHNSLAEHYMLER